MTLRRFTPLVTCTLFVSCATLEDEPWSRFGRGSTALGISSGWASYEAEADVEGRTGVLAGSEGEDTADLEPNYGGALKLHHMVSDHLALGGIVELRSFDPDSIRPLDAELTAEDFETIHLIASSRYFFDAFGEARRLRPFVGLDLSFIPEVELGDVNVDYSPLPLPSETIAVTGSSYWAIGFVGGVQILLNDNTSLDFGAFYETALSSSDETLSFQSLGGAEADVEIEPRGVIGFVGLTYSL